MFHVVTLAFCDNAFKVKKSYSLSFCNEYSIVSNRRIRQILAGAIRHKKKGKKAILSITNSPRCDITLPSLIIEQQLFISTKIFVCN